MRGTVLDDAASVQWFDGSSTLTTQELELDDSEQVLVRPETIQNVIA